MSFTRRSRKQKPGLPELVLLLLVGLTAYCAFNWEKTLGEPGWEKTNGWVTSCEIKKTHYNAQPSDDKVAITYNYDAHAGTYPGSWEGYWPRIHSPNALPEGNIEVLKQPNYPLIVMFDPHDPSKSRLHNPDSDRQITWVILTFGAGVALAFYLIRIYPAWRERRSHRLR